MLTYCVGRIPAQVKAWMSLCPKEAMHNVYVHCSCAITRPYSNKVSFDLTYIHNTYHRSGNFRCQNIFVGPFNHEKKHEIYFTTTHGISSPPGGRSLQYRLLPVTVQWISPPLLRKSEQTRRIFLRMCPITVPFFFTTTAYLSTLFRGSCSQESTLPTAASQMSW